MPLKFTENAKSGVSEGGKHEKPPQAVGLQGSVLLYSFGCQTPLFYFLIKIYLS